MKVYPARALTFPHARASSTGPGVSEIAIEGLVCSVCAGRVRAALEAVPGVVDAQVDLERGRAVVRHDRPVAARDLEAAARRPVVLPSLRKALALAGDLARRMPRPAGARRTA